MKLEQHHHLVITQGPHSGLRGLRGRGELCLILCIKTMPVIALVGEKVELVSGNKLTSIEYSYCPLFFIILDLLLGASFLGQKY
jgi:hypothetical protein